MRLYPTWDQIKTLKNPLTEGELALVKFLDNYLPKDPTWTKDKAIENYNGWLIFVQPFLNGSRPDVIIFNPFVGVVIYEVKDWNLKNYSWEKGYDGYTSLYVQDGNGRHSIKSPVNQVEHYKDKIISQLVPIIGEQIDKDKKNFGLVKTALYFHKATTFQSQKLFGAKIKDFKYFPVFGYDFLKPDNLNQIVPDVRITKSKFWDRRWNKELIFWLNPPYHSIEQGIPLKLKYNQVKVAEPTSGHHRVRGVAGSGKTQALSYRAAKLASMNLNVLVVTFNITLWHYIKDMISRAPFNFKWDKITFTHFHGFCKDKLNEFGEKWPHLNTGDRRNGESEIALEHFFKVTVPEAVIRTVSGKKYER